MDRKDRNLMDVVCASCRDALEQAQIQWQPQEYPQIWPRPESNQFCLVQNQSVGVEMRNLDDSLIVNRKRSMSTYRLEGLGSSLPQAGCGRVARLPKVPVFEQGGRTIEGIPELWSGSNLHAASDGLNRLYGRRLLPFLDLGIAQSDFQLSKANLNQAAREHWRE